MLYRQKNDLHVRLFELCVTPHRIVVQSVESRLVLAHSGLYQMEACTELAGIKKRVFGHLAT